jgi:DNA-binding NarL/FixJ family response regulator
MTPWRWNELTARQQQIALAVVLDFNTKQKLIGERFGICHMTVNHHLRLVYAVLGIRNKMELAFELGRHWNEISKEKRSP